MNFYCLVFIIVCFCQNLLQNQAYNYCNYKDGDEKNPCPDGLIHVVCDPDTIPRKSELVTIAPMTEKMKNLLLDSHNEHRNKMACGDLSTNGISFGKATRMRMVVWDDELEYIAKMAVQQCNLYHDQCRNKQHIPFFCGQNLGAMWKGDQDLLNMCALFTRVWFSEYENIDNVTSLPKSMPKEGNEKPIGHFTGMVSDNLSRIGCAISNCTEGWYIGCNYDYLSMYGERLYEEGDEASKCSDWETGVSAKFKCLCENSGKIFV